MITKEAAQEIVKCAQRNHVGFYHWGSFLPKGSIVHKQIDDDTYGIQLYIRNLDGYPAYSKIKTELGNIFAKQNMFCENEIDMGVNSGWHKELHFRKNAITAKEPEVESTIIPTSNSTQIFGNVTITDSNLITGNENTVSKTTAPVQSSEEKSDKGWFKKEIVKWMLGILSALIVAALLAWLKLSN